MKALQQLGIQRASEFVSRLDGQNALIFTNMNPFKLFLVLEKSKVSLPARAGDIATENIIIPSGNTGIPPGPVLSEFKEAGVPTRIESGNIFVSKDTIVARPGDSISPKLAGLLARLNLKPIKAGLSIFMASLRAYCCCRRILSSISTSTGESCSRPCLKHSAYLSKRRT